MTTGCTFYDWGGKPAIVQDGKARAVFTIGGAWQGELPGDGVNVAALRAAVLSIGRDAFDDRFVLWCLTGLDGWYQRRDSARPYPATQRPASMPLLTPAGLKIRSRSIWMRCPCPYTSAIAPRPVKCQKLKFVESLHRNMA